MQALTPQERTLLAFVCLCLVGGVAWRAWGRTAPAMTLHAEPAEFPALPAAVGPGGEEAAPHDPGRRRRRGPPRGVQSERRKDARAERDQSEPPRRSRSGARGRGTREPGVRLERTRRVTELVAPFVRPGAAPP